MREYTFWFHYKEKPSSVQTPYPNKVKSAEHTPLQTRGSRVYSAIWHSQQKRSLWESMKSKTKGEGGENKSINIFILPFLQTAQHSIHSSPLFHFILIITPSRRLGLWQSGHLNPAYFTRSLWEQLFSSARLKSRLELEEVKGGKECSLFRSKRVLILWLNF